MDATALDGVATLFLGKGFRHVRALTMNETIMQHAWASFF